MPPRRLRFHVLALAVLAPLCALTLQGSMCADLVELPLEATYPLDPNDDNQKLLFEMAVNSPSAADDEDIDRFCRDVDAAWLGYEPDEPMAACWLAPQARSVDLLQSSVGSALAKYAGGLAGVFIRDATYRFEVNEVPADIPSADVFLSTQERLAGDWGCLLMDHAMFDSGNRANCDNKGLTTIPDLSRVCEGTEDLSEYCRRQPWFPSLCAPMIGDAALGELCASETYRRLTAAGLGPENLVLLGSTHPAWQAAWAAGIENFPSATGVLRIPRRGENIDLLSRVIINDGRFRFDLVVVPREPTVLPRSVVEQLVALDKKPQARMRLELKIILVVHPL